MNLFFEIQTLKLMIFYMDYQEFVANLDYDTFVKLSKSINYILLSSFEFKSVLLISSVKNIMPFKIIYDLFKEYLCQFYFFLDGLFYHQLDLFLGIFIIFKFKFPFHDTLFCLLHFYLRYHHLRSNYKLFLLMQKVLT